MQKWKSEKNVFTGRRCLRWLCLMCCLRNIPECCCSYSRQCTPALPSAVSEHKSIAYSRKIHAENSVASLGGGGGGGDGVVNAIFLVIIADSERVLHPCWFSTCDPLNQITPLNHCPLNRFTCLTFAFDQLCTYMYVCMNECASIHGYCLNIAVLSIWVGVLKRMWTLVCFVCTWFIMCMCM